MEGLLSTGPTPSSFRTVPATPGLLIRDLEEWQEAYRDNEKWKEADTDLAGGIEEC